MLTRTVALFSFGLAAVLFGAAQTEAQPGKGFSKGPKGPGVGSDIQKLENDLNRLLDQVKETQAQLARLKESAGNKGRGEKDQGKDFEGEGRGGFYGKGKRGFEGKWKGFEGNWKGDFEGKGPFGGKGFPGKGPSFGPKGEKGAKLDPEIIKKKYEFYKGLYEESQRESSRSKGKGGPKGPPKSDSAPTPPTKGRGFGGGGPAGSSSVESRIDRLIRELEALRSEVKDDKKR